MENEAMTLLQGALATLPPRAFSHNRFPSDYQDLYSNLVNSAMREAPQVDGFMTMHAILVERMAYLYVEQKIQDGKSAADVLWKVYHADFRAMIKVVEALLKEMRTLTGDKSYKAAFGAAIVDVINRNVASTQERAACAREIRRLVSAK